MVAQFFIIQESNNSISLIDIYLINIKINIIYYENFHISKIMCNKLIYVLYGIKLTITFTFNHNIEKILKKRKGKIFIFISN